MTKKVLSRELLEKVLKLAEIETEFIEVSYSKGIVIVEPKHLQCVQCGCTDETKLIVKGGVHVCTECIEDMQDFVERTEGM